MFTQSSSNYVDSLYIGLATSPPPPPVFFMKSWEKLDKVMQAGLLSQYWG